MRRVAWVLGVIAVVFALSALECTPRTVEVIGLWLFTGSGTIEAEITELVLNITETGGSAGTLLTDIDSIDAGSRHIQSTVVSSTGAWAGWDGYTLYWTWELSGGELLLAMHYTDYPVSATSGYNNMGPFTRQ